jgi:hypothetical protein
MAQKKHIGLALTLPKKGTHAGFRGKTIDVDLVIVS